MPYHFLEHVATADVAFEAWGDTIEDVFVSAAAATMNVMVQELAAIELRERRGIRLQTEAVDMLLFELLQELIYYKDAERLLLRVPEVRVRRDPAGFTLEADAYGEPIDAQKHELIVDVKAVTLHRFQVEQTASGWRAFVILDI
jgi:SHS2 domain-containing protein